MGTSQITVKFADLLGQRFEAVEMLVDTGATFTTAPKGPLERLGVPGEVVLHLTPHLAQALGGDAGVGGHAVAVEERLVEPQASRHP